MEETIKILLDIKESIGGIRHDITGIHGWMEHHDKRHGLLESQIGGQGCELGRQGELWRQQERLNNEAQKKISGLYRAVGEAEDTGIHHITEEKTRWKTLQVVGAVILGAMTFLGGMLTLSHGCKPSAAQQNQGGK